VSELTHKDLLWFRLANANPDRDFYPFKDRFLKRFATPDGFDLQVIERECWTCVGSGTGPDGGPCRKCGGDGVYATNKHWLKRFDLCGSIYHKPMWECDARADNGGKNPEPKNHIEGRIKHGDVDSKVARRAFYRLLLRHEPVTFYNIVTDRMLAKMSNVRANLVWKLIRLRNKLDLFKAVPEDDVPF
jgi:hypothetical protein